jgi:Flp pilus assembly protein TadG
MRQVTVTADVTGATAPVILDQYQNPFSVTYSNSGSGTVQVSVTDPYPVVNGNYATATFTWITAPTSAPNSATSLGQPFRAIRISGGASGDTLTVIQSGVKG